MAPADSSIRRRVVVCLLALIVAYGALLRFEAFHRTYGPLRGGARATHTQETIADLASHLRPSKIQWTRGLYPYRFDAKSYLDSAREMHHFYEGRLREPVFVAVTKAALWLTGGQDIAVSAMSAFSSTLLVAATFLLGRLLGGSLVGLAASLIVAIDPDLVAWSARGYRDDFFGLVTVLFACTCLSFVRRASWPRAVLVGVIGAAACLTRITALGFVAPALLLLVFSHGLAEWRRMLPLVSVSALVTAALFVPYLIGCWMRYGDPLYAINWHTGFYLRREFGDRRGRTGIGQYLMIHLGADILRSTDTLLRGLTTYPLANKWRGLAEYWSPWLAWSLKALCVPGLLMWLWSRPGRLVLVVLGTALLPFAVTWQVYSDWRFTLHAIPFFVVASVIAVARTTAAIAARPSGDRAQTPPTRILTRQILISTAVLAVVVMAIYTLPPAIFASDLARGQPAGIAAGERDLLYFGRDWHAARKEGDVTYRYVKGTQGSIWVPLTRAGGYTCVLRVDPTPGTVSRLALEVEVNGRWREHIPLEYDPQRVGRYQFNIPSGVLHRGLNTIEFRAGTEPANAAGVESAFRLWYLRFTPE